MKTNNKPPLFIRNRLLTYTFCFVLSVIFSLIIIYGFYLIFPYLYMALANVDRKTLGDDYGAALQFLMLSIIMLFVLIPSIYFYSLRLIRRKFVLSK